MITATPVNRLLASILSVLLLAAGSPDAGSAETVSPVAEDAALSDQQDAEPLTQEQVRADSEIRSRLQALYDRIGSLRDVTVGGASVSGEKPSPWRLDRERSRWRRAPRASSSSRTTSGWPRI